ncbi:hypothetical protein SAMN02745146_3767 [Hymenobacter daecheongensis DSM 21074]|uniref:Uncharacterized protein n=1 Tax=Hymenobacter daecheongensis DSM 21074 TaxID=1121955 RepID=A0A1M6LHT5_9BACT|nr:hypothetical protein [Hymenobacter daecheongensis]SHJ70766.1 hypothetical protein SAMN02745146_3767 [Hymenobacter daecheongensis DSM 21074]
MEAEKVSRHPRVAGRCLTSHTGRKAVIYDNAVDGCCYLRGRGEEVSPFDFTVHNVKGQIFHFVQVDKCMFSDREEIRRCDCLVFNDTVSLFIDFKGNRSYNSRKKGRKSALEQIATSVAWFMNEGLLQEQESVEVIVANGTHNRHPRFNDNIIDKTLELQNRFPTLRIQYNELPFRKL